MTEFYDEQRHKDKIVSICFDFVIGYNMPSPYIQNNGESIYLIDDIYISPSELYKCIEIAREKYNNSFKKYL